MLYWYESSVLGRAASRGKFKNNNNKKKMSQLVSGFFSEMAKDLGYLAPVVGL